MSSEASNDGNGGNDGQRQTVGRFYIEGGALYGPALYMQEQGDAKLAGILAGTDTVFNMTSHLSPDIYTAILVALQTDYAGWAGMRQLINDLTRTSTATADARA
jgi:hypothetical protein